MKKRRTLGDATLLELHDLLRVEGLGVEWINPVAGPGAFASVFVVRDGATRILSAALDSSLDDFVRLCRASARTAS